MLVFLIRANLLDIKGQKNSKTILNKKKKNNFINVLKRSDFFPTPNNADTCEN